MAFPQTILPIKVELQLNSAWTDITTDLRAEQQIRITRGRSDEGQQTDTTKCTFTLDNNASAYSPQNPTGPYYGAIGRNTPVRVSVMTGSTYLDLPGGSNDYAQTADVAALDITGDIDVRADLTLANWLPPVGSSSTGTVEMVGKFSSGGGLKSWFLGTRDGRLYFEWSTDGSNSLSASSTIAPIIPGAGGRLAIRATLDVNNGAGGWTCTFYTADNIDAPFTQLGSPVTGAGVTSIFNSTSPVRVGNATGFTFQLPIGRCQAVEIRNGIGGTVVAQPRFDQQTVGAASFVDSAGRTWTMNGNAQLTNRRTRFSGEISAWPARWETKKDVVVNVEASGVLRRLTQGASPVRSPMYREFTNPSRAGIVAYWPMEDESTAASFASALSGQAAMNLPGAGGVTPAAYADWTASAALPTYSFGVTKVRLPGYTPTNYIFTRVFAAVPAGGVTGTDRLFGFTTTGTARTWSVFVNTAGNLDLRAYDADGTQLFASGFGTFAINGLKRVVGVELTQNGANIDWKLFVLKVDTSTLAFTDASSLTGTLNAYTCGAATEARLGQDGLLNGTALGHMAFASSSAAYANTGGASIGWNGEVTTARLYRLGQEEMLPCYSASISEEPMGVQSTSKLVDLLREAESADEGILIESRSFFPGFRFRDHVSLCNQAPAMVLDYTGASGLVTPFEPNYDDQSVRNDRTVQRTNGSSTRKTLDTGALSTQSPPNGVGRYDDSTTENLYADSQTPDHAGWLLHLGTWDETRYPVVQMRLSKVPALLETVAAVDVGDRFQITNPPAWLPPDTIDLMVQGYQEVLDQFTWDIAFNCTPAGPWDVTFAGDGTTTSSSREWKWVDTDGSLLAGALTSTSATADVYSTVAGPVWTPNVRDTPFDWRIAGEVMTVVAPGNLVNANAFFDTDTTGWDPQNSTIVRDTTVVHPHPRAKASLKITPDGSLASANAVAPALAVGSIQPGTSYTVSMWVFTWGGYGNIQPAVNWHAADNSYISTSASAGFGVAAATWTYLEQTFTAPANASLARVLPNEGGSPTATNIYYVWAARITRTSSSWLYDQFGRTAASGWAQADSGQAWTTSGGAAADYAVGTGYGSHTLATANVSRRTITALTYPDFDYYVDVTTSAAATGGSLFGGPVTRYIDTDNLYQARIEFTTTNTVLLTIRKRVTATETQLGTYTLEIGTYTAGQFIRVRFQGSGTVLRAKAWRATATEPDAWHVTVSDSSITTSSFIGVRSISAAANTNVNPQLRYQNLNLINPQTYTLTRSQNRVVKAQSATAGVALAYPAYLAL